MLEAYSDIHESILIQVFSLYPSRSSSVHFNPPPSSLSLPIYAASFANLTALYLPGSFYFYDLSIALKTDNTLYLIALPEGYSCKNLCSQDANLESGIFLQHVNKREILYSVLSHPDKNSRINTGNCVILWNSGLNSLSFDAFFVV